MLATDMEQWYTVSRMKQQVETACERRGTRVVSQEYIWETFDSLFKTVHRQGRRVEELEARVIDLERRLSERAVEQQKTPHIVNEMPAERAA
jgi:tRNA(Phe) wybutosine-synthesizing methylase Tyw3